MQKNVLLSLLYTAKQEFYAPQTCHGKSAWRGCEWLAVIDGVDDREHIELMRWCNQIKRVNVVVGSNI